MPNANNLRVKGPGRSSGRRPKQGYPTSTADVKTATAKLSMLNLNSQVSDVSTLVASTEGPAASVNSRYTETEKERQISSKTPNFSASPKRRNLSAELDNLAWQLAQLREGGRLDLLSMLRRDDSMMLTHSATAENIYSVEAIPRSRRIVTDWVAIDCEMVGVGLRGSSSALGRVSVVNKWGYPLFDAFVLPDEPITQWRTRWSGLSRRVFEKARLRGNLISLDEAREQVESIIAGRVLIGHSIKNDLKVLKLREQPPHVIDTQMFPHYPKLLLQKQPGLKNALYTLLGIVIQNSSEGHSSVEDAQATMLLFRVLRLGFEMELRKWERER